MTNDDREQLIDMLRQETRKDKFHASVDHNGLHTLFWIALLSSILSGASGLSALIPKEIVGLLGALPAACLLIVTAYPFEARATWHNAYANKTDDLLKQLMFEGKQVREVSESYRKLREEFDKTYPGLTTELFKKVFSRQ